MDDSLEKVISESIDKLCERIQQLTFEIRELKEQIKFNTVTDAKGFYVNNNTGETKEYDDIQKIYEKTSSNTCDRIN